MSDFSSAGGDGGRPWLIRCDGKPFTSYNTKKECEAYIEMQKGKEKSCPKGKDTHAVKCSWTIEQRGDD